MNLVWYLELQGIKLEVNLILLHRRVSRGTKEFQSIQLALDIFPALPEKEEWVAP